MMSSYVAQRTARFRRSQKRTPKAKARPSSIDRRYCHFDFLANRRSINFSSWRRPNYLPVRFGDFLATLAAPSYVCCALRPAIPGAGFSGRGWLELADGCLWG
jgi:hypothetical protein